MLETIEIETAPNPTAAIVWLHGLGADGHDFEPVVPEIVGRRERAWRFVFPHAPIRSVTINGGMSMRAWYDILAFSRPQHLLARVAYPFSRAAQRRFAHDSKAAMLRTVC